MKKNKYWKRRLGDMFEGRSGYWQHLDLRIIRGFDDDGLSFVVDHVRAVNLLDLDRTRISNNAIALLGNLEYIKELRLKEVSALDNACIEDLARIRGLEFLQISDTGITIDGLLQLNNPGLKELRFSALITQELGEKIQQLRDHLPDASFIVNGKHWLFDPVQL